MDTIKRLSSNPLVQEVSISAVVQALIWWIVGHQHVGTATVTIGTNGQLILASLFLGAAAYLVVKRHFLSRVGPILAAAAGALIVLSLHHQNLLLLIGLFPCVTLILMCIPKLDLQTEFGLIILGMGFALSFPIIFFYATHRFLSIQFLWELMPLMASYWFFYEPEFITRPKNWLWTLITPLILAILLLSLPLSWRSITAIILVIVTWFGRPFVANRYHFIMTTLLQLAFTLILY
ncbi:hypothetical protein [Levilactobacillus bambusae]|uniref:Uncharacterized protein n=1 Tax=Levilactobacillus bambusae TaxID=2024736 RepID=A0A2V1N1K9_9LACO|nr:hypothetical protein [Levilactobacillus bambusae]PWG01094.1 hypothetical protein DCM90_02660 [Levilactobacillus bambusae]